MAAATTTTTRPGTDAAPFPYRMNPATRRTPPTNPSPNRASHSRGRQGRRPFVILLAPSGRSRNRASSRRRRPRSGGAVARRRRSRRPSGRRRRDTPVRGASGAPTSFRESPGVTRRSPPSAPSRRHPGPPPRGRRARTGRRETPRGWPVGRVPAAATATASLPASTRRRAVNRSFTPDGGGQRPIDPRSFDRRLTLGYALAASIRLTRPCDRTRLDCRPHAWRAFPSS